MSEQTGVTHDGKASWLADRFRSLCGETFVLSEGTYRWFGTATCSACRRAKREGRQVQW